MTKSLANWIPCLFILLLTAGPTAAQVDLESGPSKGLSRDARAYAENFGIDIEEAHRRLELQKRVGVLDEFLSTETRETFGGLWIEQEPSFKVIVLSTDVSVTRSFFEEDVVGDLASLIQVRPAQVTLADLEAQLDQTNSLLRANDLRADTSLNVRDGVVEIYTLEPSRLKASLASRNLALAPRARTIQVPSLSRPSADIRGGRPITECTAGFTIRTPTGQLGLSTAGHCLNNPTYLDSSTPLTLKAEHFSGSHDVQWHSAACTEDVRNQIYDGTGNRTISGTVGRDSQALGALVCKHGKTTGFTCGTITSKWYCPSYVLNGTSTFITVSGTNISDSGDSGGPWFSGNDAYGIHSGGNEAGTLAIYTAVNWLETVGYPVLTYAAGVTPWVNLSCTVSASNFSCSAVGNNGTPPYTFSNWQYWGPAGSWQSGSTSIHGNYGFPGCTPGEFNSVQVRITDACGRTSLGGTQFYCPERCGPFDICDF